MSGVGNTSDIPADYRDKLDLREQIVRIDQLREEGLKFMAEQRKLTAEAAKLDRDRWLAPWLVLVAVIGGVVGAIGGIITVLGAIAHLKG
jgi:hypothetical protein